MFLLCSVLMCSLCAVVNSLPTPTDTYANSIMLVQPDVYRLLWNYTAENLTAEIHVKTLGWVGFGISRTGLMKNSDIIVAWITNSKSGTTTKFADCYTSGYNLYVDKSQDWYLLASLEVDGYTIIKFQRSLSLCNSEDLSIEEGTPYVIYAWDSLDPTDYISYHGAGNRGAQPVPLISSVQPVARAENTSTTVFTFPLSISSDKPSSYRCKFFNLSSSWGISFTTKQQLIKFTTETAQGNYLYDWIMYACPVNYAPATISTDSCNPNVNNAWTSVLSSDCSKVVILWTKGNFLTQQFPVNTGYSFGGTNAFSIFVIRAHYENPNGVQNLAETLNLIFTYTPTLRDYNIGTLALGRSANYQGITLPPATPLITINSYCLSSCINNLTTGFNYYYVFGSVPHTYQYGTSVVTKIVRGGSEYAYVGTNDYYNSNYQYSLFRSSPLILQQGDNLLTQCTYNTTSATNFLFAPMDEMCLNVLYYYTATNNPTQDYCFTTQPSDAWRLLLQNLNSSGSLFTANINLTDTLAQNLFLQTKVDEVVKAKFIQFYAIQPQSQTCSANQNVSIDYQPKLTNVLSSTEACALAKSSIQKPLIFLNALFYIYLIIFSLLYLD